MAALKFTGQVHRLYRFHGNGYAFIFGNDRIGGNSVYDFPLPCVVIVCRGADNIMTRSDILNVVSTALNIQKNIIAIYAMD